MRLLSRIARFFIDFLYPKTREVLELEALSAGELLRILPPAPPTESEQIIALFDYKHPLVKEIIWEVKYGGNELVAAKLGEILYDTLCHELAECGLFEKFDAPLLIPMPISDKRRAERGWNQAEILCEAIMKIDQEKPASTRGGEPTRGGIFKYKPRQLVKHYHTQSQTSTGSKSEREKNLKESMKVLAPNVVEGMNIILLDDVMTTGSTFAEARRALRLAGAKKIICIAVAH